MGWKIRGSNPAGTGDFSLLRNMQTASGPHSTTYARYRGSFPGVRHFKVTTHIDLAPRLRIRGALLTHPLYALMPWTGTDLPLPISELPQFFSDYSSFFLCHIKPK
jgi:hypothetical protein